MRYVLVNLKTEAKECACAFCKTPLGKTYVRCLETRILYHSHFCLELHEVESVRCIETIYREREGT